MDNRGFIKFYRDIQDHWIWQDSNKLKWWIDILLSANHKDNKFLLGNELFEVKRGSFHTSELKLSERWNVSRNTVRNFLSLLENDEMIEQIKSKKGTTLKVSNYNDYQGVFDSEKTTKGQQTEQQKDHTLNNKRTIKGQYTEQIKDHTLNTNKNEKNDKECIKNDKECKKNEKNDKETINSILIAYAQGELVDVLKDFVEMRKTMRKPLTARAMKMILNDLDKLAVDDRTKIAIVEQSIKNSWQGVFHLKNNTHHNQIYKNNNSNTDDFARALEEMQKEGYT